MSLENLAKYEHLECLESGHSYCCYGRKSITAFGLYDPCASAWRHSPSYHPPLCEGLLALPLLDCYELCTCAGSDAILHWEYRLGVGASACWWVLTSHIQATCF